MTRLDGRTAVVTGGTGGIGRAIATTLAAAGASVIVTGRDAARGGEVIDRIRADGGKAEFVRADLGGGAAAVRELADEVGDVDILVNNAAALSAGQSLLEVTEERIDQVLSMNVKVPFLLTAALVPAMIRNGRGAVVNIGSVAGTKAMGTFALYGASKAAMHLLTRSWADELAAKGVRVNTVAPGPTVTELNEDLRDVLAQVTAGYPSGRPSTAAEIAAAVVFLAGDDALNIHGATLAVDGGGSAI